MPTPTATIFLPYSALDAVILRGARAAQPAASAVVPGTLYCVTDEGAKVERSSGTTWQVYSPTPGGGGAGTGDVVGPGVATDQAIALYDGTTGKLIQDSATTIPALTASIESSVTASVIPVDLATETTGTLPDARLSTNVQMKPIAATDLPAHATRHQPGGADALAVDAAAATGSLRTLGPGAQQAAPGNDARFGAPTAPTAHHATHETGGSDAIVALSGAVITSGTVADARLSANVPLLNAPNVFTQTQVVSETRPDVQVQFTGDVSRGHLFAAVPNQCYVSHNLTYDGAHWNLDDTSRGGTLIQLQGGVFAVFGCPAGPNPVTLLNTFGVDATGAVTIIKPVSVPSGGTGAASLAAHGVLVGEGAGAVVATAPGAAGQVLMSRGGTLDPIFQTLPPQIFMDARLTLTFGISVTTVDTGGNTLILSPHVGRRCTVFDSSGNATTLLLTEFGIALPSTVNTNYDVFIFNNGGTLAMEVLAWTNDTTRAVAVNKVTGAVDASGIYCKAGDLTRRYIGTVRNGTTAGATEDSLWHRYVWNYYNRVRRPLLRKETTASWTYGTVTWRQANGNPANQVECVIGVPEAVVLLHAAAVAGNPVSTSNLAVGIGEDSTALLVSIGGHAAVAVGAVDSMTASMTRSPTVGHHAYLWMEIASATTNWYATTAIAFTDQGLSGSVDA